MTEADKKYWEELNKQWGTNIPCPTSIDLDMEAVAYDLAMGDSFDGAIQRNLEVSYEQNITTVS